MYSKIKRSSLIITLIILFFTKPTFVDVFPQLSIINVIYDACRVVLMITIPIYYFIKKNHSINIYFIIAIHVVLLVSTFINRGDLRSVVLAFGTILSCCMITELYSRDEPVKFLRSLRTLLFVYIFLNFITLIVFPGGWFSSGEINSDNWFLGNKNLFILFHLPYLFVTYTVAAYEKRRFHMLDYLGISITIMSTVLSESATGIMGVGVFFIVYCLKDVFKKGISAKMGLIVSYTMFVIIVILNLAKLFGFLIVTILHRNLTLTVRTYVWEYALKWFKTSPLYGVGIQPSDIAKQHMFRYYHPHCTYLYYLVFAGVIGFVVYTAYLIYVSNKIDKQRGKISIPCVAAFWSILIIYITEVYSRPELFFMVFTIAVCLPENLPIKASNKNKRRKKRKYLEFRPVRTKQVHS